MTITFLALPKAGKALVDDAVSGIGAKARMPLTANPEMPSCSNCRLFVMRSVSYLPSIEASLVSMDFAQIS